MLKRKILHILSFVFVLGLLTGCNNETSEELMKKSFEQGLEIKEAEMTTVLEGELITADQTLEYVLSGTEVDDKLKYDFNANLATKRKNDKYIINGEFGANGVSITSKIYGNKQKTYIDVPIINDTVVINNEKYLNDNQTLDDYFKIQEQIQKDYFQFIKENIKFNDYLIVEEPVKVETSYNSRNVKLRKVNVTLKLDAEHIKKNALDFLTFIENNENMKNFILNSIESQDSDISREDVLSEFEKGLVTASKEMDELTVEEIEEVLVDVRKILENLNIDLYFNKDDLLVKGETSFSFEEEENLLNLKITQEIFNIGNVADFEIKENENATPIEDYFNFFN